VSLEATMMLHIHFTVCLISHQY